MYKNSPKITQETSDEADAKSAAAFSDPNKVAKVIGYENAGKAFDAAPTQKESPSLPSGAGAAELFGTENIQSVKQQESKMSSQADKDMHGITGNKVANFVTGEVAVIESIKPEFDESGFTKPVDGASQHVAGHIAGDL